MTEKQAHTPGPWYVDEDDRPGMQWNRHIYSQPADHAVCFMAHSDGKAPERDEANARLIAAAPELLEAAREALELIGDDLSAPANDTANKLRSAILRATGKE